MNRPLTPRQLDVLRFLADFQAREGCMPTSAEIAQHFGFASSNGAVEHVACLAAKGALERIPNRARALRLTPYGRSFVLAPGKDWQNMPRNLLALPVVDMWRINRLAGVA